MTDRENIIKNIINHGDILMRRCGDGYIVFSLNDMDKVFDDGNVNMSALDDTFFKADNVEDMLHHLVSIMETCYDLPLIKLERRGHGDAEE